MIHIPGERHKAPDAVSHHPTGSTNPDLLQFPDDIAAIENPTSFFSLTPLCIQSWLGYVAKNHHWMHAPTTFDDKLTSSAVSALRTMAITWDRVKLATTSDKDLTQLVSIIESGFPESRHEIPPALQEYYQFRKHLYTVDGVILYKDHIVILPSLWQHILAILHSAHQGITSMTAHAESSVFWPGITPAITDLQANCSHCNTMAPSQPSALPFPPITPVYPFQSICADFFQHKGFNYLVIVDRYSNWPIIERGHDGSKGLIDCL